MVLRGFGKQGKKALHPHDLRNLGHIYITTEERKR